jgi:cobalt-zinc-cadmium efflux system outer membrane protein
MRTPALKWVFAWTAFLLAVAAQAQTPPTPFSWQQIKDKFAAGNPTLKAAEASIAESKAAEVTAYLRPNPSLTGTLDQLNFFSTQPSPSGNGGNSYQPFAYALPYGQLSYLHERQHKRELRLEAAKKSTDITISGYSDQQRGLIFNLKNNFVQVLQAKAFLQNAKDNLAYWDKELDINRTRLQAGDIAQIDYDRLVLQRVQFESDYETALVNLRTAKIQMLNLLNDRTPIEQFDVSGPYDFSEQLMAQDDFRKEALATRPDLRAAVQGVELADINHKLAIANGSTDPTFSVDFARNPPIPVYIGVSVSIPLRIFDRNQGEKERTRFEAQSARFAEIAARNQVLSDVDQAWSAYDSASGIAKRYNSHYVDEARRVRDNIEFSYRHGSTTLLDYLDALRDYRQVNLDSLTANQQVWLSIHQLSFAAATEIVP